MERELWKILSQHITALDRQQPRGQRMHSVGRIVRVFLWAALHDRPVYWACDRRNWPGVRPPVRLPDQSTMSRRLREHDSQSMLAQLAERLEPLGLTAWLRYLDGKPLTVSRHSADRQAAFGRGAGGMDRGYKLHAVYAENNRPIAWSVTPLNVSEPRVARSLISRDTGEGYLLADASYDANHLYDRAGMAGIQLLTPRRYSQAKGVGHRRHSDSRLATIARQQAPCPFVRDLLSERRRVETRFAHLCSFGGGLTHLPPWVRGLPRVKLWVHAKILIRLARDQYLRSDVA